MEAPHVNDIIGGLQAVAGGQPQALGQLVSQYAQGAAQQLVPTELARAAAALPLNLSSDGLSLAPQKLEGALQHVLGTLSPGALHTLQTITNVLPGGLNDLLHPADALNHAWFGQVGQHLLQEALPPQLQQFAAAGQQVLAAAGGHLPLAGPAAPPTQVAQAPAEPPAEPAADTKDNKKAKTSASKPPVKTGWLDAKKERYEQRMELIDKAESRRREINSPQFSKAIDRLKFNNVAVERWRLSADVYNYQAVRNPTAANFAQAHKLGYRVMMDVPARNGQPRQVLFHKGTPPEGWHAAQVWDDQTTGLNAVLYQSTFERGGQPVLAFAGTETNRIGGPKAPVDVLSDYNQAHTTARPFGFRVPIARQYAAAIALSRQVANRYPRATTTGHSLGGGLASAAAVVAGFKAHTFNAAGLHPDTVAPYGITKADIARKAGRIEAFHSSGDQLTRFQRDNASATNPFRMYRGDDVPEAIGNQRTVGTGPHGPSGTGIEEGLEKQKAADTATIHQYLAGQKR